MPQRKSAAGQNQALGQPLRPVRVQRPQNRLRGKRFRQRARPPAATKKPSPLEAQKQRVLERRPPAAVQPRKRCRPEHLGRFRPGLRAGRRRGSRSEQRQTSRHGALPPKSRQRLGKLQQRHAGRKSRLRIKPQSPLFLRSSESFLPWARLAALRQPLEFLQCRIGRQMNELRSLRVHPNPCPRSLPAAERGVLPFRQTKAQPAARCPIT